MDKEEDYMDFKSLRAKFQEEELLLRKQPRTKPALAEKPKVLPPSRSPTNTLTSLSPNSHTAFTSNNLPHGAQPSILSTLQDKGGMEHRFTFKDVKDKKAKSKDEGKLKLLGKNKEDEGMNGGNDIVDGPKKEDLYMKSTKSKKGGALLSTGGSKGSSVELVTVPPPPGNVTVKRKGFLGIKKTLKSGKKGKDDNHPFPLLDIASADLACPEPLTPLTTFRTPAPSLDTPIPSPLYQPSPATRIALLPRAQAPVLSLGPDRNPGIALSPPNLISAPAAQVSTVVTTPSPITVMRDAPVVQPIPNTVAASTLEPSPSLCPNTACEKHSAHRCYPSPTHLCGRASTSDHYPPSPTHYHHGNSSNVCHLRPPTIAIAPSSQHAKTTLPPADFATLDTADRNSSPPLHTPPPPKRGSLGDNDTDLSSRSGPPSHIPPFPAASLDSQLERPLSAQDRPLTPLSVLGRVSEMTPSKRKGSDIIFLALEKAKRKYVSPLTPPTPSSPVTPTTEDSPVFLSSSPSFEKSFQYLPPIDYDDQADAPYATTLDSTLVNGIRHESPSLDRIKEEGAEDMLPALLVVPPPATRRQLPDLSILGPTPEKPPRQPSVDRNTYAVEIAAPSEFSEAHPGFDPPALDDVQSELEALKLQSTPGPLQMDTSEWENGLYDDPRALPLEAGRGPHTILPRNMPLDKKAESHEKDREMSGSEPMVDSVPVSPSSPDAPSASGYQDVHYEGWENAYEPLSSDKKKAKVQPTKKTKAKNPYAVPSSPTEEKARPGRFSKKSFSGSTDERDVKKKEKQRLEKERKEQKEQKEREKKEQKEREKKENDRNKKFKITGQEEAMYQATVTEASKGRKDNLPVNVGDIVSVIRTTNCPKGKWLARDSSNTYGYVSVSQVQLDIQEMLAIGKMASQANSRNVNAYSLKQAGEVSSKNSNTYAQQEDTASFTDDSEEWPGDDEEPQSYPADGVTESTVHSRTKSMPVLGTTEASSSHHQHSLSETTTDGMDLESKNEALQKLTTFFRKPVGKSIKRPEEPEREEAPTSSVDLEGREPVFTHKAEDTYYLLQLKNSWW
ncbi:hypothetical protein UPYG_G00028450 [Umbra pygmaea]|uniref:Helically-extended SH3 domain-containing protein n=1 Tax=Umbra pygmaea TaxID=75934 RepID=A0ABD0XM76_UMBPY